DVDDVEPRRLRPACGLGVEALELADAGPVELARVAERVQVRRDLARRAGNFPARGPFRGRAAVPELDAGEGAVLVRLLAHEREVAHVVVVPEPNDGARRAVGLRVNRRQLRADDGPAAFGLRRAETRLRAGLVGAEPGAVRHLVEAVAEHLRPDPH